MQSWVSVAMACRQLGVSHQRVYELVKQGRLRSMRLGSFRLIYVPDVTEWAKRREGR